MSWLLRLKLEDWCRLILERQYFMRVQLRRREMDWFNAIIIFVTGTRNSYVQISCCHQLWHCCCVIFGVYCWIILKFSRNKIYARVRADEQIFNRIINRRKQKRITCRSVETRCCVKVAFVFIASRLNRLMSLDL